jgi:F-box protein 11
MGRDAHIAEPGVDLAAAILSAAPGGVIHLRPGFYELPGLRLDKPIQILGDGRGEAITIRLLAPLHLAGSQIELRGVTLLGRNPAPKEPSPAGCAIYISHGSPQIADCDITSETGSCIGIEGTGTAPLLSDCRIHDAADSGILISRSATPVIQRCEIARCKGLGLIAIDDAAPVLRDSRFRDGTGNGLVFRQRAKGLVHNCEIAGHELSNVVLQHGADPTFQSCTIRDGGQGGVFAREQAKGSFENCDIRGNAGTGVEISESFTSLTGCRIHGGLSHGILIVRGSECWLDRCDVFENKFVNLGVLQNSEATLNECIIRDGASNGVTVKDGAMATLRACELTGNSQANLAVADRASATLRKCRIASGRGAGVQCETGASVNLHECDIDAHALPNIAATRLGKVHLYDSLIHRGKQSGVLASMGGSVRLERSKILENAKFGVEPIGDGVIEIIDCEFAGNRSGDRHSR